MYFLNLVDEADLLALIEDDTPAATPATVVTPEPAPTPTPEPTPEPQKSNTGGMLIVLLLLVLSGWKGGRSMTQNHEEHIRHNFDSFCKKVLKYKAIDLQRQMKRRGEREVTFSELSARELASLAVTDEYFRDEYVFSILGESVGVSDVDLAEALNALPADRRDIVLMSYFFDMTDREIAELLNMARRTVAYKRTSSLQELKKLLESEE